MKQNQSLSRGLGSGHYYEDLSNSIRETIESASTGEDCLQRLIDAILASGGTAEQVQRVRDNAQLPHEPMDLVDCLNRGLKRKVHVVTDAEIVQPGATSQAETVSEEQEQEVEINVNHKIVTPKTAADIIEERNWREVLAQVEAMKRPQKQRYNPFRR